MEYFAQRSEKRALKYEVLVRYVTADQTPMEATVSVIELHEAAGMLHAIDRKIEALQREADAVVMDLVDEVRGRSGGRRQRRAQCKICQFPVIGSAKLPF